MSCPECGSNDLSFIPAQPVRHDQPGNDEYWECLGCGAALEDPDQDQPEILEGEM